MLTGALVPRWGTVAGVPGPRRSADECDAGWFAPVATRRRPFFSVGSATCGRAQSIPAIAGPAYSVLRNWAIAIAIIASPMTATIPSDSHPGTAHPPQVSPGVSRCCATAGTLRWLSTACRIGPTT
jgi:hypothetical protein